VGSTQLPPPVTLKTIHFDYTSIYGFRVKLRRNSNFFPYTALTCLFSLLSSQRFHFPSPYLLTSQRFSFTRRTSGQRLITFTAVRLNSVSCVIVVVILFPLPCFFLFFFFRFGCASGKSCNRLSRSKPCVVFLYSRKIFISYQHSTLHCMLPLQSIKH
jgi:hypothetical protein